MQKRYQIIIALIIELIILLHFLYITLDNNISIEDENYANIQQRIQNLITENSILSNTILLRGSLSYISVEAIKMGFVPQGSSAIVYLY